MSFLDIPEGTDVIEVRKQINQMLSEARKSAKPTSGLADRHERNPCFYEKVRQKTDHWPGADPDAGDAGRTAG